MRRPLSVLLLLLAAGCGGPQNETAQEQPSSSYDVAEDAAPPSAPALERTASVAGGPNVSPTAAPGVAFNYRYAFRLPAERIAQVQEQHARTCEGLGVARCRITGMRYRVVNERDIEGMLAFKLDPSIARRFGQTGVEAVAQAEGMLAESEITGTDVGTSIRASGRSIAEMNAELARLEAELARGGKSSVERQQLEYQAQQLRQSIRAQQATREEQQESLANTPMVFAYGSGELVPGPGRAPSFRDAARDAWNNFLQGLVILFIVVVTLLPWALLGLLVWWLVRLIRRRLPRRGAAPLADEEVSAPPAG